MKAITIWPEWAWAIDPDTLAKDVENRRWDPRRSIEIGERFAIHAGKHIGGHPSSKARGDAIRGLMFMAESAGWIAAQFTGEPHNKDHRLAAITFERDGLEVEFKLNEIPRSAVVSVVTLASVSGGFGSMWDVPGQVHWGLSDVVKLPEPILCRGRQGLWSLPPAIEIEVSRQLDAARVADDQWEAF